MAQNKTQRTTRSVAAFLAAIKDPGQRRDAKALAALIRKVTGKSPAMWGTSIVGYGQTTYTGSGGRTVDWFPVGFSPRKAALTVYLMGGLSAEPALLKRLGKHKVGGGCLYLPALDDVDLKVLGKLIAASYRRNAKGTPAPAATKPRPRSRRRE